MEFPSALKKSPSEPASARCTTRSALIVRAKKNLFIELLIVRRDKVWRRSPLRSTLCGKTAACSALIVRWRKSSFSEIFRAKENRSDDVILRRERDRPQFRR